MLEQSQKLDTPTPTKTTQKQQLKVEVHQTTPPTRACAEKRVRHSHPNGASGEISLEGRLRLQESPQELDR